MNMRMDSNRVLRVANCGIMVLSLAPKTSGIEESLEDELWTETEGESSSNKKMMTDTNKITTAKEDKCGNGETRKLQRLSLREIVLYFFIGREVEFLNQTARDLLTVKETGLTPPKTLNARFHFPKDCRKRSFANVRGVSYGCVCVGWGFEFLDAHVSCFQNPTRRPTTQHPES